MSVISPAVSYRDVQHRYGIMDGLVVSRRDAAILYSRLTRHCCLTASAFLFIIVLIVFIAVFESRHFVAGETALLCTLFSFSGNLCNKPESSYYFTNHLSPHFLFHNFRKLFEHFVRVLYSLTKWLATSLMIYLTV